MKTLSTTLWTILAYLLISFNSNAQETPFRNILGDTNWFPLNSGTIDDLSDIYFVNDTMGWAVGENGTIIKTTNGGTIWHAQNIDSYYDIRGVYFTDEKNGWLTLFYPDVNIFFTKNSGLTWTKHKPDHLEVNDIHFWDKDIGWCTANYDAGSSPTDTACILKSTDGGLSWTRKLIVTPEVQLLSVYFLDSLHGWTGGYYDDYTGNSMGIVYKTTDSGESWTLAADSLDGWGIDIMFVDDSTGWIVGGANGYIAKTTNGGTTWTTLDNGKQESYRKVYFTNNYTGWVVGSISGGGYGGIIRKTIDGGETWEYQINGDTEPLASICFSNDYYGWAVGPNGLIIHTESGGEEIQVDPYKRSAVKKTINDFQTTEDYLTINPPKNKGQVLSLIGVEVLIDTVLHTSDSDLEFTLSHNGISKTLIAQAGGNGDNFIGTKLTDGAMDHISSGWAPFRGNYKPENPLSPFAGTDPTGTWTLSIYDGVAGNTGILQAWGLVLIYNSASGIEEGAVSLQFELYPNPATGEFRVFSSEFRVSRATLELFSVDGKKLFEKQIPAGNEEITVDVRSLHSGIYFCRITVGNKSVTKKLVIE